MSGGGKLLTVAEVGARPNAIGDPGVRWVGRKMVRATKREYIYFIQSGGPAGPVKIGYTAKLRGRERLISMQPGNPEPMVLLAEICGSRDEEALLHRHFRALHLRGEWFHYREPLVSFVAAIAARDPV